MEGKSSTQRKRLTFTCQLKMSEFRMSDSSHPSPNYSKPWNETEIVRFLKCVRSLAF